MKVVVIGGGAGGLSTASNIRKYDENAEITVI
ncbi:MAG: NAD(P)-binding protein, partial [Methanobacteriaceae archaeon]|nr:NAD(P)-binding protein [Methanobacteriaceae archaeon]